MGGSIAENIFIDYEIEPGFRILKIQNKENIIQEYNKDCTSNIIQLHFGLRNSAKLLFNQGRYGIDINENKSLLLYNPQKNLPIQLAVEPNGKVIVLLISIEIFHSFFTQEAGLIHFLNDENSEKKYYSDKDLSPNEIVVINQMFHYGLHSSLEKLYTKGKIFELLSLYFHRNDNDGIQNCPFLEDEKNVEKIKLAKEILIKNLTNPPTLAGLSDQVNLPIQHLKDGFRHIYGETAFTFLFNYKMEYARKLLSSKKYNVAETSFEVGYSTASHFIAAFKKKYGATPKKYLNSLGS
ncbi:MAG: AraC family transcriptional regulator [Bacteroidota bacterium]